MTLALHANFKEKPSLTPRVGPTFTCTRAGNWFCAGNWHGKRYGVMPNAPRFDGFDFMNHVMLDSDNLLSANWTRTNVTAAQNANDPGGNANKAWTLTDDAINANHFVVQTDATIQGNWAYGTNMSIIKSVFVNVTESTASYITIGASVDAGNGSEDITVRLSDGVIVDGAEYYRWGSNADWEGVRRFTGSDGDTWLEIALSNYRTSAANGNICIGFNNTGVTATGDAYVGTGSTLVICYPQGWSYMNNCRDPIELPKHFRMAEPAAGTYYNPRIGNECNMHNTQLAGYRGKGTTPNQLYWAATYGWFEGATATANADRVDISSEPGAKINLDGPWFLIREDSTWDEANAVRVYGTGQYSLYWEDWAGMVGYGDSMVASIKIDACAQKPTGPIMRIKMENSPTDDIYAYMDDVDPQTGRLSVPFRSWRGSPYQIIIGLGVDGTDDTGDFTWSRPQVHYGKEPTSEYRPISYATWAGNVWMDSTFEDNGSFSPQGRGLLIEPAKTNLIVAPRDWSNVAWSYTNGQEHNANTYRFCDEYYNTPRGGAGWLKGLGTGTGEISIQQTVSGLANNARYSVEWYHWGAFGIGQGTRETWRWHDVVHASQDLDIYARASTEMDSYTGLDRLSLGATLGADWDYTEVKQTNYWWGYVVGEFTTDAVATTAIVKGGCADADNDNQVSISASRNAYNAPYFMCAGGMPKYPNAVDTAAADIIQTTDMSWWTGSGTFVLRFRTGNEWQDNTFLSLSDNTTDNRIEIISDSSGILNLELWQGAPAAGTKQVDIVGPTLARNTEYDVVVRISAGQADLWVNGTRYTPDTAFTIPTVTQMNLGSNWNDAQVMMGHVYELGYFTDQLDDFQCSALSSVKDNLDNITA